MRDKWRNNMTKSNVSTNWSEATRNPFRAIIKLIHCAQAGYNCWIARIPNKDCSYPITIVNPQLNHKRNWSVNYGVIGNLEEVAKQSFINETEKDLSLNYVTDKNCKPVKRSAKLQKEKENTWIYFWKAKEGIKYHVPDPKINKVFIVCFNEKKSEVHTPTWLKIVNALISPLRFIPQYSNLDMGTYKCHTFRIGDVTNGFTIEFQMPKKFSFSS